MRILKVAGLSMTIMSSVAFAEEDCTKFIVNDIYSYSSNYESYERVKDALCKDDALDRQSARNSATKAGIPIPIADAVFKLDFEHTNSSKDWTKWRSLFCESHFRDVENRITIKDFARIFGENAQDIVKTCLTKNTLYGYFKVEENSFTFRLHPASGRESIKSANIFPDSAVRGCNVPLKNPFNIDSKAPRDISGQDSEFYCKWDTSQDVSVIVNLTTAGQKSFVLPARPKRVSTSASCPKQAKAVITMRKAQTMNWVFSYPLPEGFDCTSSTPENATFNTHPGNVNVPCPVLRIHDGIADSGYFDGGSDAGGIPADAYFNNRGSCAYTITCVAK